MEISETREGRAQSCLDMRMLPIKIHYFLAFGAIGGVMPFLPVLAKSLNIHSTAVGMIYTIIPISVLLAKPLFGSISDHFQNIKKVITSIIYCLIIAYLLILSIPPIQIKQETSASITCQDLSSNTTLPGHYDPECLLERINLGTVCHMVGECAGETYPTVTNQICRKTNNNITLATPDVKFTVCSSLNDTKTENNSSHILPISYISTCSCLASKNLSLNCNPNFEECAMTSAKNDYSEVYYSSQFWLFLLLALIGNSCSAAMFSLSDAACFELLGDRPDLYGRQRMFATISWGSVALLAGYLNDVASANLGSTSYAPGFYIMAALAVLDLIILHKVVDLKQSKSSQNIFKDIRSLFSSLRVVTFAVAVAIVGALSGMLWSYQFWYLQTLGANQLLLGLTITVQCLAAEVPFFFFSGWIINRLGHTLCIIFTFLAMSLRILMYYFLTNPWYVLPIEILHGWTFGVFYSTMTSYARRYAPPGAEATMQGVLGGMFEGLGIAIGSLLGGFGFDQLGGRRTFKIAAIVSAISAVVYSIMTAVIKRKESRNRYEQVRSFRDTNYCTFAK